MKLGTIKCFHRQLNVILGNSAVSWRRPECDITLGASTLMKYLAIYGTYLHHL